MLRLQARNFGQDQDTSEFTRYLNSVPILLQEGDSLLWWKSYMTEFPSLAGMARDILSILLTSISVERLFSSARDVIQRGRNQLGALMIQDILIAKSWEKR